MRREWEPDDLIACWTLVEADQELVANKSGATRLGFAVLLKFFELDARFPRDVSELPPAAVSYVAEQVRVDSRELDAYAWSGRTIEYHRAQIRQAYGFRKRRVATRATSRRGCRRRSARSSSRVIGSARRCWFVAANSASSRRGVSTGSWVPRSRRLSSVLC